MESSADSQRQLVIGGAGAVAALLLGLATTWAIKDYNAYIALGPGGPPNNFFGWAIVNIAVRPFCSTKAKATFTDDYPKHGAHNNIESLPRRRGPRASVAGLVPHRQVTQRAPETMRTPVSNLFENAASENPDILE
ncbi:hypothetical protein VD0002_g2782 [Verticillium dahliae]|uniref:Uncharacterized protein n=1 Tax=Verticillium dahliae TaxID=27337 RepID=A0AA44WC37_VERDA|nr:hypothetical protein BJF96_g8869 [Verticillium dahliae]PNH47305.1 hypothetical protein VD0004_g982 [Verticillium dahliae]PNH55948.1 hypothetical protein VD0003_g1689 [Verticillium dahliae]PNH66619.1 hypothetical protein VD0002_g2782 [Verticillium dahliae]PNH76685.1 hypothetical protein VD0001_g858 [Verticillium dahliae]